MKNCPYCNSQLDDNAVFCSVCGKSLTGNPAPQAQASVGSDHTAEFTPKDISDNKVVAMLCYLLGPVGIIIALLGSHNSPYAAFHVRQALKFTVCQVLLALVSAILIWTFIVPILAGIAFIVLFVCQIICFVQICMGQAKDAPIIGSLPFLK